MISEDGPHKSRLAFDIGTGIGVLKGQCVVVTSARSQPLHLGIGQACHEDKLKWSTGTQRDSDLAFGSALIRGRGSRSNR